MYYKLRDFVVVLKCAGVALEVVGILCYVGSAIKQVKIRIRGGKVKHYWIALGYGVDSENEYNSLGRSEG